MTHASASIHARKGESKEAHAKSHSWAHHRHSPFFVIWEMVGLACVLFLAMTFALEIFFHPGKATLELIHLADIAAEVILITEVLLIFLVARNKIHFIKTKWMTILSVVPFGNAFRFVRLIKLGWHAFEKTRVGQFIEHPIRSTKRWLRRKLHLHFKK
ncbi:MAG: hypothetical protein IPJ89_03210 [Candidatus Iainarchaeum archaeon]|uniref:Ion transporter n=1 Tax=Candidatus Iainarchaeum sp. TaxID=3101447 RepID=A0A7T9DJ20_9ARCH|nr:MAG: hypothetical protein IPJ89_03210 [Candidatus Diapherotrites archaeon]